MQSAIGIPPSDFVAAFARQRQQLLHRAGTLLTSAEVEENVPMLTQCLATSLEELKVAEEELFDQHLKSEASRGEQDRLLAYFRSLFHFAPTPLFLTTTDGSIRAVNKAGAELVTRDVYRLEGKPIAALVPPASRAEFRRQLALLLNAGGVASWCFTLLRHTDIPIRVEATVTLAPREITGAAAFYWNVRTI